VTVLDPPTIEARQVSKWFGSVVALSDLTFDIRPGVTAMLGPNGAASQPSSGCCAAW
jgi:ABC-2 type transport system ATP-binding protein